MRAEISGEKYGSDATQGIKNFAVSVGRLSSGDLSALKSFR
jgi:hypothetical protein